MKMTYLLTLLIFISPYSGLCNSAIFGNEHIISFESQFSAQQMKLNSSGEPAVATNIQHSYTSSLPIVGINAAIIKYETASGAKKARIVGKIFAKGRKLIQQNINLSFQINDDGTLKLPTEKSVFTTRYNNEYGSPVKFEFTINKHAEINAQSLNINNEQYLPKGNIIRDSTEILNKYGVRALQAQIGIKNKVNIPSPHGMIRDHYFVVLGIQIPSGSPHSQYGLNYFSSYNTGKIIERDPIFPYGTSEYISNIPENLKNGITIEGEILNVGIRYDRGFFLTNTTLTENTRRLADNPNEYEMITDKFESTNSMGSKCEFTFTKKAN